MFDLDETLLDRTESLKKFCTWQGQSQYGMDEAHTDRFIRRFLELDQNGSVWKDKVYDTLKCEFPVLTTSTIDFVSTYVSEFAKFCTPKAGAPKAVQKLHEAGYKLALVSNGVSPFQERNFEALGLTSYFDEVVVSDAVGCKKPEKEIFLITCSRLGVDPSECIFVGDNPVADIQGAASLGMYTIFVPGNFGTACPGADAVCNNYRELPSMVIHAS